MYDLIIVGAGASGLFCASNLNPKGKILIIEGTDKPGKKLLLSGGGRCNFTNENINIKDSYFSQNINFLHSVFHKYSNVDFVKFLDKNNISYKIENNGKYYLKSDKSVELLNLFLEIIKNKGIKINLQTRLLDINYNNGTFNLNTTNGEYQSKAVVISTGGNSFPQIGTNGIGYIIGKKFGAEINTIYKGLSGIDLKEDVSKYAGSPLDGEIQIKINGKVIIKKSGTILFTHKGISGPDIFDMTLQLGSILTMKGIDNLDEYINKYGQVLIKFEKQNLSRKLIKLISENQQLEFNIEKIGDWQTAKVTGGGISLKSIDNNFQSKSIERLFYIGEALDVTGKTGGYNLQFAWSGGYICASYINEFILN